MVLSKPLLVQYRIILDLIVTYTFGNIGRNDKNLTISRITMPKLKTLGSEILSLKSYDMINYNLSQSSNGHENKQLAYNAYFGLGNGAKQHRHEWSLSH